MILKALRAHLQALGVEIRFGTQVQRLDIRAGAVCGVHLEG